MSFHILAILVPIFCTIHTPIGKSLLTCRKLASEVFAPPFALRNSPATPVTHYQISKDMQPPC
jgi:hypothetical protein